METLKVCQKSEPVLVKEVKQTGGHGTSERARPLSSGELWRVGWGIVVALL